MKEIKNNLKNLHSDAIVTTLKDFVKIKNYFQEFEVFIIDVQHTIIKEERLLAHLKKKIK
jgi:tetraacyldisaccharide-1-P 4'-kinase